MIFGFMTAERMFKLETSADFGGYDGSVYIGSVQSLIHYGRTYSSNT